MSSNQTKQEQEKRDDLLLTEQRNAVYHGSVVVSLGLLAGFPYTLKVYSIYKEWASSEEAVFMTTDVLMKFVMENLVPKIIGTERAWRMAHLEGLVNGFLIYIVASILPIVRGGLTNAELSSLVKSLSIAGYFNTIASIIAATYNVRGFTFAGSIQNKITCALFGSAIGAVFHAIYLLIKGSTAKVQ